MMMMKCLPTNAVVVLVSLAVLATHAAAEKDSSYYPADVSNPNVEDRMYWKDSQNVLEDLDQFSKLYVKYHTCA